MKTCTTCGAITDAAYCPQHQPKRTRRRPERYPSKSSTKRGYGTAWRKTSERARASQPWCSHCHKTAEDLGEPLQLDHSPEAWTWAEQHPGKLIPLELVTVLCGPCNRQAGAARGDGVTRERTPGGMAHSASGPTRGLLVGKLPSHMRPVLNKGA